MRPRMWLRKRCFIPAGFLVVLAAAASSEAQPVLGIPRFDFSFSNPGARSAGFGGAFVALADDATAAYANPAGLVQLTEPEVSMEARLWNRSPSFIAGGRIEGETTGIGIDTRAGLSFGRDHSQQFGPSFASIVIPKGRWSFALYGHQLAKFEMSADSQGFFTDFDPRLPASRQDTAIEAVTAAMAAGWRLNDHLSFGLGLVFSDTSVRIALAEYLPDDDSEQSQYTMISFLPERRLSLTTLAADGTAVTVNAGVLGRPSEQVSIGLFYRQGPQVRGAVESELGPAPLFPGEPPSSGTTREDAEFQVPDVLGGGFAWRSKDGRMTLATEVDRVGYAGQLRTRGNDDGLYQDGWEYHFGAEYALLRSTPIISFRAGAWIEAVEDIFFGDREVSHLAIGLGIAARSFQIDLAADFSDEVDTTSLSLVYTF